MGGSVKEDLASLGIRPSKRFGQHFLVDESVAHRQVYYAKLSKSDTVLEIGPGLGTLTRLIAPKAGRLVAIESDRRLCGHLSGKVDAEIICGDALDVPFPEFNKVVANLPYSISSPITFKLLEHDFEVGILMYQLEFAERMVARPGTKDYSRLSVMAQHRAAIEFMEKVPRTAFHPQPAVDSAIIKVAPRKPGYEVADERAFEAIVRVLFSHRRKKIRTTMCLCSRELRVSKETAERVAEESGYADARVETLEPSELAALSNLLHEARSG
ncbi:MAG: ribosomal RNA small subunit methyltransferase A [Euryarchaeota archaeon]|nr:ribosomal RNA small subunit methyltransferase A [Euryarchaeota archaeon]